MTEERFEDLINLYLDNEISRHELDELKRVIKENLVRRKQFERACQLHQAARKALVGRLAEDGNAAQTRNPTGASRSSARPASQPSSSEKLERALINATVPIMAERQTTQGAASSVKLSEVSSGRRRRSGRKGFSTNSAVTAKSLMYLGIMAVVAVIGYRFFGPTMAGDSDFSGYTPDVSALPSTAALDKGGNLMARLSDLPDDASEPFDVAKFISARTMAMAATGNTVTQSLLMEHIASQSSVTITNTTNGTNLSINVTEEQFFFKPGNLSVPPPMTGQLQRALPGVPPLAPGGAAAGVTRTTTTTIEVTSPGNGGTDSVKAGGNNTLGQDLQP